MGPLPRLSPTWLQPPAAPRKTVFRVFQDASFRWCVASSDGMTGGVFVDQKSAVRFARREAEGVLVLVSRSDVTSAEPAPKAGSL